jgi:hypothetical protein
MKHCCRSRRLDLGIPQPRMPNDDENGKLLPNDESSIDER